MTAPRTPLPVHSVDAARVQALARLLDTAIRIPGTSVRVGLDAILGVLPGVGDMAGALLSGYSILAAARLGAPASVLVRMLLNVGVDTVVGAVPVLGDLFDVAWRSNARNAAVLERYLANPGTTAKASRGVVAGVLIAVLLLVALAIAGTIATLRWIF